MRSLQLQYRRQLGNYSITMMKNYLKIYGSSAIHYQIKPNSELTNWAMAFGNGNVMGVLSRDYNNHEILVPMTLVNITSSKEMSMLSSVTIDLPIFNDILYQIGDIIAVSNDERQFLYYVDNVENVGSNLYYKLTLTSVESRSQLTYNESEGDGLNMVDIEEAWRDLQ